MSNGKKVYRLTKFWLTGAFRDAVTVDDRSLNENRPGMKVGTERRRGGACCRRVNDHKTTVNSLPVVNSDVGDAGGGNAARHHRQ